MRLCTSSVGSSPTYQHVATELFAVNDAVDGQRAALGADGKVSLLVAGHQRVGHWLIFGIESPKVDDGRSNRTSLAD